MSGRRPARRAGARRRRGLEGEVVPGGFADLDPC
jgi:hypothetical protein